MSLKKVKIVSLPKITDNRGNLSFIEESDHVPFKFKRVYWIYDVPGGQIRGGHAFKVQREFVVALSGSFDIVLNDGKTEQRHHLNRSYYGLYIPKGLWRHMENFSTNAVVLVISSTCNNKSDYIRGFNEYQKYMGNG